MSFILLGILNAQAAGAPAGEGAYDLLETTTLASDTSSVTFSGLDSYTDYKHLQLRMIYRSDRSSSLDAIEGRFNSDSSSSYAHHNLSANGSSVNANAATSTTIIRFGTAAAASSASNIFGANILDILDFSDTSKNTTIRNLTGVLGGTSQVQLQSGLYFKTDAITSMNFFPQIGANFVSGTRFSLYGFKETV